MVGIISQHVSIIVIFVLLYISLCIFLSFKIYYFGDVIGGTRYLITDVKEGDKFFSSLKPIRKGHFALVVVANIINFAIAGFGIYLYPSKTDFGTFLLGILLANNVLYMVFYISMKVIYYNFQFHVNSLTSVLIHLFLY